ncbi:MAG TPA: histidine kinase, partial [Blastocatellia bacterium]|nr:histidine kinase [Blastocatellia bacterium]
YGKELVALFGFLIGVMIFGLLAARVIRDLEHAPARRTAMLAALAVALLGLGWNGWCLWLSGRHALSAARAASPWLLRDWALVPALIPIPLGLFAAYKFYQAAFMDIALKRGAALLALIALAWGYAQFLEERLTLHILRLPNPTLQSVLFAAPWLAMLLVYLPLRSRIYRQIDHHLFKRRDSAQLLAEFNERLRLTTDEAGLPAVAADTLREAFAADPVRFVPAADLPKDLLDWQTPEMLLRSGSGNEALESELKKQRAELALAVRVNAELIGLMMIGARAFRQAYLSEELRLLQTIAMELSRALENLRLHEARRQQAIAEEELRKLVAQSELMALRAQINPHFFFNALNSVAALIGEDPPRAEALIENLAELFRHAFKPNSEMIPLSQELALIETYVAVEQVRLGDKMRFRCFIAPEALPVTIPALTIEPLIENAIKHGIGRCNAGGVITLSASVRDGRLTVTVADSGAGIAAEELRHLLTRGVGLSNVNNRLTKLYGEAAKLKIDSAPGQGATVSFAIPVSR